MKYLKVALNHFINSFQDKGTVQHLGSRDLNDYTEALDYKYNHINLSKN